MNTINNAIRKEFIEYLDNRKLVNETKNHKKATIVQYFDMLDSSNYPITQTGASEIDQFLLRKQYLETNTLNRVIAHIRELYRWLLANGYVEKDFSYLIRYRKESKKLPLNISSRLMNQLCTPTEEEIAYINSPLNLRNQAIIEFLYSTGIRNTELRTLKINQLSPDLHRCWIVAQKGSNDRMVFLGRYARAYLYQYLQTRGIDTNKLKPTQKYEYVFTSNRLNMMNTMTLKNIIHKLSVKRIGVPITPKVIRHTFATEMLRSHNCLRTLQKMMGHKSINSTTVYCNLAMEDKLKAIEQYHPRNRVDFSNSNN